MMKAAAVVLFLLNLLGHGEVLMALGLFNTRSMPTTQVLVLDGLAEVAGTNGVILIRSAAIPSSAKVQVSMQALMVK